MKDILFNNILPFWQEAVDRTYGGFYGKLDNRGAVDPEAPKGLVQHARFLWSYSALFKAFADPTHKERANHALEFLLHYFHNKETGGWNYLVDAQGNPLDSRNHIYALSFVVYGLSEYAAATGDVQALQLALKTYDLIENIARDHTHGGYHECFDSSFNKAPQIEEYGTSGLNKTMNTHIHLLEAYTTLLSSLCGFLIPTEPISSERARFERDKAEGTFCDANVLAGTLRSKNGFQRSLVKNIARSQGSLCHLIDLLLDRILDSQKRSLHLYFTPDWTPLPSPISFGHDIELSWLLTEAASVAAYRLSHAREACLSLAENTLLGMDSAKGGLYYEGVRMTYSPLPLAGEGQAQPHESGFVGTPGEGEILRGSFTSFEDKVYPRVKRRAQDDNSLTQNDHPPILNPTKVWWVQAEGLVGFYNAYKLSNNPLFLSARNSIYRWITQHQMDPIHGEWFDKIYPDGSRGTEKGSVWKTLYHNSRACLRTLPS